MIYGSRLFYFKKICTFARMFRTDFFRKFSSALISALYLFVVLFSQDMHHHGSGFIGKSAAGQKYAKAFSDAATGADASQCLSCHFFYTGNSLVPQDFVISVFTVREKIQEFTSYSTPLLAADSSVLFLRGPTAESV